MSRTVKLTTNALLAALAFALTYWASVLSIAPMSGAPYLHYDPKDVVIVFAGFFLGPAHAAANAFCVSAVEWLTISKTGFWGFVMNMCSSCAFAVTASAVFTRKKAFSGAAAGLGFAVLAQCAVMLLLNYLVAPLYTGWRRSDIAGLLIPVFLPFNLIKSGINAFFAALLYAPLSEAVKKRR